MAGRFGVGRLRSPREVSSSWSWLTLQFPEAYALNAHSISGARSGSSSIVRSFAAELVARADVEVADGRLAVGAAADGLLVHALGDLGGEVAGVELGDRGHDAVQQHPRGGLVDVLRRGDEHDPALLECEVDAHVVGAVAGEPVDLVDDAVRDLVGLDVLDHPHQLGPVGGLGRGAGVDELLDDARPELFGLAAGGFALRGDREPLVGAALLRLLAGGDPQVGHGDSAAPGWVDQAGRWIVGDGGHRGLTLTRFDPRAPRCRGRGVDRESSR